MYCFRFPWNWKTPSGYLAVVCMQYIWLHLLSFFVIVSLAFFTGLSTLFEALALDVKKSFANLNKSIVDTQGNFTDEQRLEFYEKLNEIIRFHSLTKE